MFGENPAPPKKDELPPGVTPGFIDPGKERQHEKLAKWILKSMDKLHQEMVLLFIKDEEERVERGEIKVDVPVDRMMTPYPMSKLLAMRMYQILQHVGMVNVNVPGSRVAIMDPMGGTGGDAMAMKEVFGPLAIMHAAEVDPVKAKFMELLFQHFQRSGGTTGELHGKITVQQTSINDLEIPNIDVLYLDPPWPYTIKEDYMIGTEEMSAFIARRFEEIPSLRMVVCKVSKGYMQGPLFRKLVNMCKEKKAYMEDFWPLAVQKVQGRDGEVWKRPDYGPHVVQLVRQPWMGDLEEWDNKWEMLIAGLDKSDTAMRFLYIMRQEQPTHLAGGRSNNSHKVLRGAPGLVKGGAPAPQKLEPEPTPASIPPRGEEAAAAVGAPLNLRWFCSSLS